MKTGMQFQYRMKHYFKQIAIVFSLAFLGLFSTAHASALYQGIRSDVQPSGSWWTNQTFTNFSGNIDNVYFSYDIASSTVSTNLGLIIYDITTSTQDAVQIDTAQGVTSTDSGIGFVYFDMDGSIVYEADKQYIFALNTGDQSRVWFWLGSSASSSYADGEESDHPTCTGQTPPQSLYVCDGHQLGDLYFRTNGDVPRTINLDFPIASSTMQDFQNWRVTGTNLDIGDSIRILYGTQASNTSETGISLFEDRYTWSYFSPFADNFPITKTQTLYYPPQDTVGWVAYARVYTSSSVLLAQSDVVYFNIGTPSSEIDCSAFSTALFTSTTMEGFFCHVKKTSYDVFNWLIDAIFVPDKIATNIIDSQYQSFKMAFPFSVFYSITGAVSSSISSTTPAQSVVYTLETPRQIGVSGAVLTASSTDDITFSSSSTLESFIGEDLQIILFNGILLMAIIGAMYISYKFLFHH